jgi:hypothetical protein
MLDRRWFFLASLLAAAAAEATQRSHAAKTSFQLEHPCPSTGRHHGKCPGYVIDHVDPLCAGGPDVPSNMQWQTIADAKAKDIKEWKLCRTLKRTRE